MKRGEMLRALRNGTWEEHYQIAASLGDVPYSEPGNVKQVNGRFFGVRTPRSMPLVDCRCADPASYYSWPTDRAAEMLGIGKNDWHTPRTIGSCPDFRLQGEKTETAMVLLTARQMLAEMWRAYRKAQRAPAGRGEGGSVEYRPRAILLNNFGVSILVQEGDCLARSLAEYR